ncbi:MAG TPA: hypothetical protein VJT54_16420 [Verrucomicrobiae bacterium]|nr:hypothetical protein [Verrucomicrobiae bacterium]
MNGSSKHDSRWTGIGLAAGAVLFVIGWRLCVIASQPAHWSAIATEIGSIPLPKEELNAQEVVPSNNGHGLIFFKETETGLGTYFWDAAIGKSKFLFEQREKWYAGDLGIVAWSPGDTFFACAFKSDPDPGRQQPTRDINIYDGNTGEAEMKITALWDSRFTWLSSNSFAYTRYNQTWLVYEQKSKGNWVQTQVVNKFGDGRLNNLTPVSPHASYADLNLVNGQYVFTIKASANSEPAHFVWKGTVEYYKQAGDYLYFTGNPINGPPGVWQYNIKSGEVQCVDSGFEGHFQYAKMVTPISGTITNASGEQMSYHVWAPAHVSPGKKYPLIIGQTHYMWYSYEQVAANCDCFFAFADRPSWWDGLSHWTTDVTSLYAILAKNPNIDTNRVFLFATSAESSQLSGFVAEDPGLWKGVILFDPVAEPDLSEAHLSKMFIASGTFDENDTKALIKYQDEAAKSGVAVRLGLQDGVQHITRSIASERERTRDFARFLVEN